MGGEKGKKVFRLRVGECRAIFTFDGEVGFLPNASWGVSKTSAQSESWIWELFQSMTSWSVGSRHRCLSYSCPCRSSFPCFLFERTIHASSLEWATVRSP